MNTSLYDASRPTVGSMYVDAHLKNRAEECIEIGDMSRELSTSLVDDINDAIREFDKKNKPYFLMIHEKKDLQMKTAILRRILYFGYRPWPEDDTVVFRKDPKTQDLRFCWALPHHSEMELVLANRDQFDPSFIKDIQEWKKFNMRHFGFVYDPELKWIPDPHFSDRLLQKNKPVSASH